MGKSEIRFITNEHEKEQIATFILNDLPDWFGLPESTMEYIKESKRMPFWASFSEDKPNGFIVLKETSKYTAEIYVMGVLKDEHHSGIVTRLWNYFLQYAKEHGYEYVQVKTVESGNNKYYDITNKFYKHLGFRELEVFRTLWDEWNPCQVYVMGIKEII